MPKQRWPALLGLVAIAVLAGGCGETRTITGNASPVVTARITLNPAPGASITKPDTDATIAVIERRLKDLGIGNYSLAAGNAITVDLTGGADVTSAQLAVQRAGVATFVPLGPTDSPPPIGSFPTGLANPLWPGNEIASATVGKDQNGNPTLVLTMTPDGAQILGAWTSAHVMATILLLLDGQVVAAPIVTAPITGDTMWITTEAGLPLPIKAVAAILDSGPLMPDWRHP